MRVLYINRKQLGITLLLIGLMLVLFAFEKNFENKLKLTLLIENDIKYLKQYDTGKEGINYKLPSEWKTSLENYTGGEILYHNNFQSSDSVIHGFVQVINIKKELRSYLEESKIISEKQNKIYEYNISPVKVKKNSGYLVKYEIEAKQGVVYTCYEYFIDINGKIIRFSFYVRENSYKENMAGVFSVIVNTVEIK
ncbi:MAG: hypothetical protein ACM3X7_01465 [Solirubrobacterales bacterium]